jgi:gamma-glutamyl-gamma-aminobutyrate hydrolase PuuD
MMGLPRIGLTTYREQASFGVWNVPTDLLPVSYADSITAAGGVPMLLPPPSLDHSPDVAAASVLSGLQGVVISGGADVDPARYDADRDTATGPARPDRDGWELVLVREALRRDLPLLGVCRGMQVLNVALGGTLTQHLPDVVHTNSHQPEIGIHGRHDVVMADGSRLAGIVGRTAEVATYHHQAVDTLPDAVTACGWAEDGTIEAFEVRDATWALGVQWHPEAYNGADLFRAFVQAAAKTSDPCP